MTMTPCVVLATDGSDDALDAARRGLAITGPADRVIVATAVPAVDPTLVTGTGLAGGVVSPEGLDELTREQDEEGRAVIAATVEALGIEAEARVLRGEPGPELCELAREENASVIVVGSRGHGALKRALLGSVSHHLVHNAPCPVLVVRPHPDAD